MTFALFLEIVLVTLVVTSIVVGFVWKKTHSTPWKWAWFGIEAAIIWLRRAFRRLIGKGPEI